MATKSKINQNNRKIELVERYAAKRKELKAAMYNPSLSDEEREAARKSFNKLPRSASATRIRNRCSITGRPRGFIRKFGLCRIKFRELALLGQLPGVTKSSW